MNLQTYIEKLVALRDEHGRDLEVVDAYSRPVDDPDFDTDSDGNPVIVICDEA